MGEKEMYLCPKCGEETDKSCIAYGCLRAYCPKCDDVFLVRDEVIEDDIVAESHI